MSVPRRSDHEARPIREILKSRITEERCSICRRDPAADRARQQDSLDDRASINGLRELADRRDHLSVEVRCDVRGVERQTVPVHTESGGLGDRAGDRVVITSEIDALWNEANALMSWLVEKPARDDN